MSAARRQTRRSQPAITPTEPTFTTFAKPTAASFQLLNLLPPPLLALAASHLPLASLLCLQRCSSALRVLRAHEQYMTGAWRGIKLSLENDNYCRLILQACPYLQHLRLYINIKTRTQPSHEDTIALVPRLRSLTLFPKDSSKWEPRHANVQPRVRFAFGRLLDSLPHLTSLYYVNLRTGVRDLLDIASHSTLEELHIEADGQELIDTKWIGRETMLFPVDVEYDAMQLARAAASMNVDDGAEEQSDSSEEEEEKAPTARAEAVSAMDAETTTNNRQRMHTALTRTQPTRRSCELRLALADWLHRRLNRELPVDGSLHPDWLLRHYRQQVALLRSTLAEQLSALPVELTSTGRGLFEYGAPSR